MTSGDTAALVTRNVPPPPPPDSLAPPDDAPHSEIVAAPPGHNPRLDIWGVGQLYCGHLELAAVVILLHLARGLLTALDPAHWTPSPSLGVDIHFIGECTRLAPHAG